ncbi:hypothetical protein SLEP1_g46942 [Rubroshorea leprosula]|uniref:Uncharacterized protein n=1 Tax=Rubroshorea leprosula TaxID=152421 RepID=A0AAV5LQJ7_9ROSI|nr:hypothetical protein SLEP1_g46942 [Rubroshorea leprosula]
MISSKALESSSWEVGTQTEPFGTVASILSSTFFSCSCFARYLWSKKTAKMRKGERERERDPKTENVIDGVFVCWESDAGAGVRAGLRRHLLSALAPSCYVIAVFFTPIGR